MCVDILSYNSGRFAKRLQNPELDVIAMSVVGLAEAGRRPFAVSRARKSAGGALARP